MNQTENSEGCREIKKNGRRGLQKKARNDHANMLSKDSYATTHLYININAETLRRKSVSKEDFLFLLYNDIIIKNNLHKYFTFYSRL